jgi:phosphomannomutase
MQQLAAIMRWLQADLGAAINVDGDRIGFVTREAEALSEEYALPLAAAIRLKRRPGAVATNLSTSRMIDAIAREHGQAVVRTPVGESPVIDMGMAEEAVLAGEGSGGVAALPTTMMFDGLLTLGYVLELMAATGESLSALVDGFPRFVMRKRQLACPPNLVYKVLDRFRARYADQSPNTADGVRVAWEDAWLHVRASNTEPLLRVIVEADTAERADALMEETYTFARRATYGHGGSQA